jgi:membrane protein YdbS with pleckstrin-like domain
MAQQAAYDFRRNQTQRGDHRPAQDGRAQRWVRVSMVMMMPVTVAMAVIVMGGTRGRSRTGHAVVVVIVSVCMHRCLHSYSTRLAWRGEVTCALSGHLDTLLSRFH